MRLRCCVLLCALSGGAFADSAQDYFSKAFKLAAPSPFESQLPSAGAPSGSRFTLDFGFVGNGIQVLDLKQALVSQPGHCAIALLPYAVPRDRKFSIRDFPIGDSAKLDPMGTPTMPVCQQ